MKKDIIFTTAFKDINRGTWPVIGPAGRRSNQHYIDCFLSLTNNIKYKLIVYVEQDMLDILTANYKLDSGYWFKDYKR